MPRAYASSAVTPAGEWRYWTATLYNKYLPDKTVFYDPGFPPFGPDNAESAKRVESGTPATYGMRDWVKPGELVGNGTRLAKKVSIIQKPSDFFIVADSYWTAWKTQGYGISPGLDGSNCVRLDKKGWASALFLDGHIEKKRKEYFESLGETQGQYSDNQGFTTWTETE